MKDTKIFAHIQYSFLFRFFVTYSLFLASFYSINGKNISSTNIDYFVNIHRSPISNSFIDPEAPNYKYYIANRLGTKISNEYLIFGIPTNLVYFGLSIQALIQLENFSIGSILGFPWQLWKVAGALHGYLLFPLAKTPYYSLQNQLSFFHESRYVSDNNSFIQDNQLFLLSYRTDLYPLEYFKYKFSHKFVFKKLKIQYSMGFKVFYKPLLFFGNRYASFSILQEIGISYQINHSLAISIRYYYEFQDIITLLLENPNDSNENRIIEDAQYHILDLALTINSTPYNLSFFFQYNYSNGRSFDFSKHYGHIYGIGLRFLL